MATSDETATSAPPPGLNTTSSAAATGNTSAITSTSRTRNANFVSSGSLSLSSPTLSVAISHVDYSPVSQTLYVIRVIENGVEWQVRHPYSEFRGLRDEILRATRQWKDDSSVTFCMALAQLPFPSKRLFGSKKEHVVKKRAQELHTFLMSLLDITHRYRKAHKQQLARAPSFESDGSVGVLDALKDFLKTSDYDPDGNNYTANAQSNAVARTEPTRGASNSAAATTRLPLTSSVSLDRSASARVLTSKERDASIQKNVQAPVSDGLLVDEHMQTRTNASPSTTAYVEFDARNTDPALAGIAGKLNRMSSGVESAPMDVTATAVTTKAIAPTAPVATAASSSSSSLPLHTSQRRLSRSMVDMKASGTPLRSPPTEKSKKKSKKKKQKQNAPVFSPQTTGSPIGTSGHIPILESEEMVNLKAEAELEKYVSPENALMLLRYIDRFVAKCAVRQPGPYRITPDNVLQIDAERFCEELEDSFSGQPLTAILMNDADEWRIPTHMDAYVQFKWHSFQQSANQGHGRGRKKTQVGDERSDSETEAWDDTSGAWFMKPKAKFTTDEIDVLEKMMATGHASREQLVRMRRQVIDEKFSQQLVRPSRAHIRQKQASMSSLDVRSSDASSVASHDEDEEEASSDEDDVEEDEDFEAFVQRKSRQISLSARTLDIYNRKLGLETGGLV